MLDRVNFPLAVQTTSDFPLAFASADSISNVSQALFPEGLPQEVVSVIQNANSALTNASDKLRNAIRLTMASPFYNLN
jgi:hypothetical protein